jgi:hypothetical protein
MVSVMDTAGFKIPGCPESKVSIHTGISLLLN